MIGQMWCGKNKKWAKCMKIAKKTCKRKRFFKGTEGAVSMQGGMSSTGKSDKKKRRRRRLGLGEPVRFTWIGSGYKPSSSHFLSLKRRRRLGRGVWAAFDIKKLCCFFYSLFSHFLSLKINPHLLRRANNTPTRWFAGPIGRRRRAGELNRPFFENKTQFQESFFA